MANHTSKYVAMLFVVTFFSLQYDADARRRRGIPFLFTTGETFSDYHSITGKDLAFLFPSAAGTADVDAAANSGVKVSFKYDRFGLFFINLWTWGGKVVLYEESKNTYYDVEVSQAEAIKKYGKPFFYKFPPLLIAVVVGGGVWLFGVFGAASAGARSSRSSGPSKGHMPTPGLNPGTTPGGGGPPNQRKPIPLKKEYTQEQLQEMYDDPRYQHALQLLEETDSFIKPIEYLVANGIPENEAGQNLSELKKAIAESQG